ncbi:MAG: gliding motility-associated C-terminal domain-containing protein [Chitinophagales bacterium]|nr:gliding motility-associated C-terminal domain-containing protein [Chitinophagales bacterium]
MRKGFYFLTLIFCLGLFDATAAYFNITTLSGVQVVGGVTVTVNPINGPNTGTTCGTGPYQIGKLHTDGYEYRFGGTGVTQVRFEMIRIHDDDTIRFDVDNGSGYTQYNLTGANLTPYAGTCSMTSNNMTTPGGLLSTTGGATGAGQGVQVDISLTPANIYGIKVTHIRAAGNAIASDVIYAAYLQDDSCSLGFVAMADSPTCSGRDIQLTSTVFPNTTYAWTTNAFQQPTWAPSRFVSDPKLLNTNQAQSGQYIVTATRGACIYKDTVNINVSQSPTTGTVTQAGPVCPNENDTIFLKNINLPIGGWAVAYGAWGRDTFDASQGYILAIKNIQTSQKGLYNIYAVDILGCYSDTFGFILNVYDDIFANFTWSVLEGCDQDTVTFVNQTSTPSGGYNSTWNFGDNTPLVQLKDTTHYYIVPKPNYDPRDYKVKLAVDNGFCYDTLEQTLTINHPVKAKYILDDDSICQGETISFYAGDSSYVKPGTIPQMLWRYGDGATDTVFDVQHQYDVAGLYTPTFVMTDFLGCSDSFKLPIVVDSNGFVFFETDKENVCVGEEITFTAKYSNYGYISAIWNFDDGVTIPDSTLVYHSYQEPKTYNVVFDIKYRICPDVSYTGQYTVKPVPTVYLGDDTTICPNGSPIFIQDVNYGSNPNTKYSWNTPEKDVTPGIWIHHHGRYAVTADLDGCKASDTLVVEKNCYINIPNAFTPNGDGNSDYFLPRQLLSRNVTSFDMQIFNRWGEQVFGTQTLNGRGWDGKYGGEDQPTGAYIYLIQVTFANGISERYQGNVTLLR